MATENPFVKLFAIDFKDHLEVKKSGNTELKYVSWAYAWAEVKKLYPTANYEVKKFNGLPYVYDPITGFMVYTSVTIEGVSHEMWLPVLDGANKAMKAVPYTYITPKWDYNPQTRRREKIGMEERTVEAASMFDVNIEPDFLSVPNRLEKSDSSPFHNSRAVDACHRVQNRTTFFQIYSFGSHCAGYSAVRDLSCTGQRFLHNE